MGQKTSTRRSACRVWKKTLRMVFQLSQRHCCRLWRTFQFQSHSSRDFQGPGTASRQNSTMIEKKRMKKAEKLAQDQEHHPTRRGIGGIVSNLASVISQMFYFLDLFLPMKLGSRPWLKPVPNQAETYGYGIYNNLVFLYPSLTFKTSRNPCS